jgi:hypothetical protein
MASIFSKRKYAGSEFLSGIAEDSSFLEYMPGLDLQGQY